MNISADDFRRHFELLSDEALVATQRDDLVPVAQACLDEEIARRGLADGEPEEPALAPSPDEHAVQQGEQLVTIATYSVGAEASMALGLLQSAGIPCKLDEQETVSFVPSDLHLIVPEAFAEEALEVLSFNLSDDDLAAQAEAAGPHPDSDPEDDEPQEELEEDGAPTRP